MSKSVLIIAAISFVLVFLFSFANNIAKGDAVKKNKKNSKDIKMLELRYLEIKFNLKREKLLNKMIYFIISLINASIISGVFLIINILELKFMWKLMIAFVFIIGFIYSIYGILGSILVKGGYDK